MRCTQSALLTSCSEKLSVTDYKLEVTSGLRRRCMCVSLVTMVLTRSQSRQTTVPVVTGVKKIRHPRRRVVKGEKSACFVAEKPSVDSFEKNGEVIDSSNMENVGASELARSTVKSKMANAVDNTSTRSVKTKMVGKASSSRSRAMEVISTLEPAVQVRVLRKTVARQNAKQRNISNKSREPTTSVTADPVTINKTVINTSEEEVAIPSISNLSIGSPSKSDSRDGSTDVASSLNVQNPDDDISKNRAVASGILIRNTDIASQTSVANTHLKNVSTAENVGSTCASSSDTVCSVVLHGKGTVSSRLYINHNFRACPPSITINRCEISSGNMKQNCLIINMPKKKVYS